MIQLLDALGEGFAFLFGPVLGVLARQRRSLPRFQAMCDRIGIQLRSTHYYEPTYRLSDLPAGAWAERHLPAIRLDAGPQLELLGKLAYGPELEAFPDVFPPIGQFGWKNDMFSYGDGEIYYSFVRHFKPKRIIEIGSGSSTQLALAAIAANAAEDPVDTCALTCVEPYENTWIGQTVATLVKERVEDLDLALFDQLGDGDILFIDSSHVIRPHGDVTREVLQILPRLRPGVIVHVHDIFTPRDYPDFWTRHERRLWNEQYLLEGWLSGNRDVEIICALNWLKHNHWDALSQACPMLRRNPAAEPGSFWMRIC